MFLSLGWESESMYIINFKMKTLFDKVEASVRNGKREKVHHSLSTKYMQPLVHRKVEFTSEIDYFEIP